MEVKPSAAADKEEGLDTLVYKACPSIEFQADGVLRSCDLRSTATVNANVASGGAMCDLNCANLSGGRFLPNHRPNSIRCSGPFARVRVLAAAFEGG
jgi:hypothetical protein